MKKTSTKLKDMLNEHYILGELPSSKLKKMKWNPVTGKTMNEEGEVEEPEAPEHTELEEAAPKMKLPKAAIKIDNIRIELDRIQNMMSYQDESGLARTKGEFKKALKAIANLKSAVSRHGRNW